MLASKRSVSQIGAQIVFYMVIICAGVVGGLVAFVCLLELFASLFAIGAPNTSTGATLVAAEFGLLFNDVLVPDLYLIVGFIILLVDAVVIRALTKKASYTSAIGVGLLLIIVAFVTSGALYHGH